MQVVHVLCDEREAPILHPVLKFRQCEMRWIRIDFTQLPPPLLVKPPNVLWVDFPSLRGGNLLDPVTFPKSVITAESAET